MKLLDSGRKIHTRTHTHTHIWWRFLDFKSNHCLKKIMSNLFKSEESIVTFTGEWIQRVKRMRVEGRRPQILSHIFVYSAVLVDYLPQAE